MRFRGFFRANGIMASTIQPTRRRRKPSRANTYSVVVPAGLPSLLAQLDPSMADKIARLASLFLLLTGATRERREYGHFISFRSACWRAQFSGNCYAGVQQAAEKIGLLEINPSYSTGGEHLGRNVEAFPESFRLSANFRSGKFVVHELHRRLRNASKRQTYTSGFDPGVDLAEQWLFERQRELHLEPVEALSIWDQHAVCRFNRGDLYGVRCEYGRMHMNTTSLSRRARAGLASPTGECPMVADVANCQPLILGAIASAEHDTADVRDWIAQCEAGTLYDSLLDVLRTGLVEPHVVQRPNYTLPVDPAKWSKAKLKKQFMFAAFAEIKGTLSSPVYAAIRVRYPTMARYIIAAKQNGYQQLAHRLQMAESELLVRTACRYIMDRRPELAATLIYDAVVAPASDIELASLAIKRAFRERYRIEPCVKVEPLAPM